MLNHRQPCTSALVADNPTISADYSVRPPLHKESTSAPPAAPVSASAAALVRTSAEGVAQANPLANKGGIPTSALVHSIPGAKAHGVHGDGSDTAPSIVPAHNAEVKAVQPKAESLQDRVKLSPPAGDGQSAPRCDWCGRPETADRGSVVPGEGGKFHAGCREEWKERRRYEGLEGPSDPDHAIAVAALEGDVPLDMGGSVAIERSYWKAAIEGQDFKAKARLEAEQRRERERKINAAMAVGRELSLSRRMPGLPITTSTGILG